LPFFGQNCSLPFSLRSLDIPQCPFEILAEALQECTLYAANNLPPGQCENPKKLCGTKEDHEKYGSLPHRNWSEDVISCQD
jgi:hypothetical protein